MAIFLLQTLSDADNVIEMGHNLPTRRSTIDQGGCLLPNSLGIRILETMIFTPSIEEIGW